MIQSADLRRLSHALATASDGALTRVVTMLETAASAEEAETLLATVRFRLRDLRPPRPMRMARLLFLPLDGVVVPPQFWKRDSGKLPRSVLQCLADQLRAVAGEEWVRLAAAAQGRAMQDAEAVGSIGRALWALAARAMPQEAPVGWQITTGLRPEDHAPLARLCISVWRQANPLWDAVEGSRGGLPEPLLRAALEPCGQDEALFAACLATLMAHAGEPWEVAGSAGQLGPMPRFVAERALDEYIEGAAPLIDAEQPGASAARALRFTVVWATLESSMAAGRPERRRRLQQLRSETDQACRAAHAAALRTKLIAPLASRTAPVDDAEIARLETTARDIRRLGAAGRRLGSASHYDAAERDLAEGVRALTGGAMPASVSRMDLARLVEIISGPDAAARLLA